MAAEQPQIIPEPVLDLLKTSSIGYLTVSSRKGDLFSYPVAFYYSHPKVYFMTPVSAAKLKFIRKNPTVSFIVDNHQIALDACGAMIQGRAKIFSIAKTVLSILSVGPKMARFAKKYPGMFTFYLKGKELPDERKLYKYRLIRIEPSKVVYWVGYEFGRYAPKNVASSEDPLAEASDETRMDTLAQMLNSADEELPLPQRVSESPEWLESLEKAGGTGILSEDERLLISSYRDFLRSASASNLVGPEVTKEEKKLLTKWKKSSSSD